MAWIEDKWPGLTVGGAASCLRCGKQTGAFRIPCGHAPSDVWLEPMDEPDPELTVAALRAQEAAGAWAGYGGAPVWELVLVDEPGPAA